MNNPKAILTGAINTLLKIKIKPIKLKIIMCPAVMFAKRRIIRENGLVKIPTTSIGRIIILKKKENNVTIKIRSFFGDNEKKESYY